MAWRRSMALAWVGLSLGCGPIVTLDDDGSPDTSDGEASTETSSPPPMTTTPGTTTAPGTSTTPPPPPLDTGDETTMGGITFLDDGFDDGIFVEECSFWEQDCPRGEKCMPWANDMGDVWNALTCRPIVDDPGQPGDACMAEYSPTSGYDTCDLGAMCWGVHPVTLEGTCVAQCEGSPKDPWCSDPNTVCFMTSDEVLALCLPACSPILQDCPADQGCYAIDELFMCLPIDPAGASEPGGPCEGIADCAPGSQCVAPELVPECLGVLGCCTPWCDITDPMADDVCLPGQACEPFFERGVSPGTEEEGLCAAPA